MNKFPYVSCFSNVDEALLFAESFYKEKQCSRYVINEHVYHNDHEPMHLSGLTYINIFYHRGR
jgi:hypothetical protein